jgi:CheY-like chemotaxis protein
MVHPLKCPTVLCVDDADAILKFYEELFGIHGYQVVAATNGYQALDAFHSNAPNIHAVVLDYDMPGMSGLDLAILLKRHDRKLPIMMVSGVHPSWEEISPYVDAALAKGVSIREIVRQVEFLVTQRFVRGV